MHASILDNRQLLLELACIQSHNQTIKMALSRLAHVLILLSFVVVVSGSGTIRGERLNGVSTTRFSRRRLMMGGIDDKEEESEGKGNAKTEEYEEESKGETKGGSSTGGGTMTGSAGKYGVAASVGVMKAGGKSSGKGQSSDAKLKAKKSKLDTKMNKIVGKGDSGKGVMGGSSGKGKSSAALKSSGGGAKAQPTDAVKAQKKAKVKTNMNMVAKEGDASPDEAMEYASPDGAYGIGGGQDEHGCYLSAGYAWCPELDACIQPFADECPVEGESFMGPIVIDCSGEMRCSVTKDCVIKEAGGNFVQGPYLTELTGTLNIPMDCTAICTGCTEFDPIDGVSGDEVMGPNDGFSGDEVMGTPAPTASPGEATSAPSFVGEAVSAVSELPLNFTMRFGFFVGTNVTEPTQDDLGALMEQVNLFYTDLFANTSDNFVAFEAFCKCFVRQNAHNSTATP